MVKENLRALQQGIRIREGQCEGDDPEVVQILEPFSVILRALGHSERADRYEAQVRELQEDTDQ